MTCKRHSVDESCRRCGAAGACEECCDCDLNDELLGDYSGRDDAEVIGGVTESCTVYDNGEPFLFEESDNEGD